MLTTQPENGFADLGLGQKLVSVLSRQGVTIPTPIQSAAIRPATEGAGLIGLAQTGTGKTYAFILPILEQFSHGRVKRALVLAPTRELALQIEEAAAPLAAAMGVRSTVLIGGASMHRQIQQLRGHPALIIATPGRLQDHLDSRTVHLKDVDIVVLDEADRMLDMGFFPAVRKIMGLATSVRQVMLFSATLPKEVAELTKQFLKDPVRIEIDRQGTASELVTQELRMVDERTKNEMLEEVLAEPHGTVLVFARTRHGARKLAKTVRSMGHSAAEIHSDRSMAQRREALDGFKRGEFRVLVATDIAARGIDVKSVGLVVNYDLPDHAEDYVHRIGRTGRAGEEGKAISFVMPDQLNLVRQIERLIQLEIPGNRPQMPQRTRPPVGHQNGHKHHARRPGGHFGGPRANGSRTYSRSAS